MQGDQEALRTVECLRGRLLAERAASKAAKDSADLMTTKLKELEEKLKKEKKSMRKAEKKLGILKKKLESLNIGFINISEESDECISILSLSDHVSETSCASISSSTLTASLSSNNNTTGLRTDSGDDLQPRSGDCSSSCCPKSENNADRGERNKRIDVAESEVEKHQDTQNNSGMKASELEEEREKEDQNHDDVDNSMALVTESMPITESKKNSSKMMKIESENVREVLDALKQIRETLHSTIQRRRMIQVG